MSATLHKQLDIEGAMRTLHLRCPCGRTEAFSQAPARQLLICHCSMCPDDTKRDDHAGGAPWVALPRARWSDDDAVSLRRTFDFAQRRYCNHCGRNLSILYDCEAHTEWVALGFLPPGADAGMQGAHTHIRQCLTSSAEGAPCCESFEAWGKCPDPCRTTQVPAPIICVNCFHRHAACRCKEPRWLNGRGPDTAVSTI
jgi:hypothetical protein